MTNLIPPESKKHLITQYWVRLCSAWAILWSVALLIGALLLYPTHLLIKGTSDAYAETAAGVTQRSESYNQMVAELNKSNQEAIAIVRNATQADLSDLVDDVWAASGQGIEVTGMNISRENGQIAPVSITGKAASRQVLASLRDRLEALSYVESVNLPIENLAQNQNITFTMTVTITSENI